MELSEYNGWENKFTWLVHVHLSSEEHLMQDMTYLVATRPIGYPAGKLVAQWVSGVLTNWQMDVPDSFRAYAGYLRLLVWDVVGSALAYADWESLVRLLTGETVSSDNLFTWSLYRSILNESHLHQPVGTLMQEAPHVYACADTLKDWFEAQINAWIDASAVRCRRNATISVVVYNLLQSAYEVINWEHVARAFQPGY
jgi:hypothetical protein